LLLEKVVEIFFSCLQLSAVEKDNLRLFKILLHLKQIFSTS